MSIIHQAGRSPGCQAGPSPRHILIYLPRWSLLHRYMMVTRSCRPVHGGGGNAHERATPPYGMHAVRPSGTSRGARCVQGPCTARSPLPPFACAPSVPHVECAGVSSLRVNPRGCELNTVHLPAAAPLSTSSARSSPSRRVCLAATAFLSPALLRRWRQPVRALLPQCAHSHRPHQRRRAWR